jgi:hypothetical protein
LSVGQKQTELGAQALYADPEPYWWHGEWRGELPGEEPREINHSKRARSRLTFIPIVKQWTPGVGGPRRHKPEAALPFHTLAPPVSKGDERQWLRVNLLTW